MTSYNFHFSTSEDAALFINQALEIAKRYGYVSLSDLSDLRGERSSYRGSLFGWTASSVACDVYMTFDTTLQDFVVLFPEPNFHRTNRSRPCETPRSHIVKTEHATSPEPINITIHVNKLAIPETYISDVFKQLSSVKDRIVNITIMP